MDMNILTGTELKQIWIFLRAVEVNGRYLSYNRIAWADTLFDFHSRIDFNETSNEIFELIWIKKI